MEITIQFTKHKDKFYVGRVREYPSFFGFGKDLEELKQDCLDKTYKVLDETLDGVFQRIDKVILDAIDNMGEKQNKIGFCFEYKGLPFFPHKPKDMTVEDATAYIREKEGYDDIDPIKYRNWLREDTLRTIAEKERRKVYKQKKKMERMMARNGI